MKVKFKFIFNKYLNYQIYFIDKFIFLKIFLFIYFERNFEEDPFN